MPTTVAQGRPKRATPKLFPTAAAYSVLGRTYKSLGDFIKAFKAANKALRLDPNHEGAHAIRWATYLLYDIEVNPGDKDPDAPVNFAIQYPSDRGWSLYNAGEYPAVPISFSMVPIGECEEFFH